MWDAIVIGSGISGLTAAAALSRAGEKILLLEQHWLAGGLTQTFRRGDWQFATGVHYLSGVADTDGPEGQFRRMLDWLSGGAMRFVPLANPYDIIRLPGFSFGICHPPERFRADLLTRFPEEAGAIDDWFSQLDAAGAAANALLLERGLPRWLAWAVRLWKRSDIATYAHRTVTEALANICDLRLRAVLGARGGDYGAAAADAPLIEHALVTAAYGTGAYYPAGGPGEFARRLVPIIKAAGGKVVLGADVTGIELADGHVSAVRYVRGGKEVREESAHIISTIGVLNTLERLPADAAPEWRDAAADLAPGPSYIALYLGFDGDIAAAGASSANIWLYEQPGDIEWLWDDPAQEDAPGLFISFPSLKDPEHKGGHTAEVLALCSSAPFARWLDRPDGHDDPAYQALKLAIGERLLAQFARHFADLAAMVRFREISTPLSQQRFVRTPAGAMYGLDMSAGRIESKALSVHTPVPGLLLAGQDVTGAGVQPSSISGMLAAAAIRPSLLRHFNG